ncbi:MAG: DegQ family serine endoprotease [Bordetella sp.]|nr:MAG: DegQ family serine endoprotease [Bordetella sp.]
MKNKIIFMISNFEKVFLLVILSITISSNFSNAQPTKNALPDFIDIVEKADPSVVNIRTTATVLVRENGAGNNDPYELFRWFFGPDLHIPGMPQPPRRQYSPKSEERTIPRGLGSGFFISSDGYILTNNHVVDDATEIIVTLTDGREFKAKVIGKDERTDIALLKIDEKGMVPLVIGDPKILKKGEWVLAIGSPFGLDSTVTSGIISAIGRDTGDYLPFIQTDVAVNPGNSGGPLLNLSGEVIGVNSQIISRSGGFMGISLAIPIDEAMHVAQQLRLTGKIIRGRIGVQISEVSKEVAKTLGLSKSEGALVSSIELYGPAEQAGVQGGDVILKFNNELIKRWSDLPRIVGQTKPGMYCDLEIWRRGKIINLSVKVEEVSSEKLKTGYPNSSSKKYPEEKNILGLGILDISNEKKSEMRIKGGVEISHVYGPAIKANLQVGDIILVINNFDINNVQHFEKILEKLDKTKSVALLVRRGDQMQWVPIHLSSKK